MTDEPLKDQDIFIISCFIKLFYTTHACTCIILLIVIFPFSHVVLISFFSFISFLSFSITLSFSPVFPSTDSIHDTFPSLVPLPINLFFRQPSYRQLSFHQRPSPTRQIAHVGGPNRGLFLASFLAKGQTSVSSHLGRL